MSVPRQPTPVAARFGSSLRLYSEDLILKEFLPLGLSRKGLRALLKSLSVPTIEIGTVRLVDSLSLFLALRAILRIGEPDFAAPTSRSVRIGGAALKGKATRLDLDRFQKNFETVVAELIYARKANALVVDRPAIRKAARDACDRIALAALQTAPPLEQAAYDRKALAHLHSLLQDAPISPESS